MTIYSDTFNGIIFLRPHSAVDYLVAQEIQERLALAVNDGARSVILDFSLARLASAAILPVILDAATRLEHRRGSMAVAGASPQMHCMLTLSGISEVVHEFRTVEEAQAQFRAHRIDKPRLSHLDDEDEY